MREWLKEARIKNKLSQKEMSEKIGCAQSCYSMIESGERQKDLDLSLVTKLSEVLGVSINYIAEQEAM